MTVRGRCAWGLATAVLVTAGCTADGGADPPPGSMEDSATSPSPAAPGTPSATGTAAPGKGEPGFEDLPECFGRPATILGSNGDDRIVGTRRDDIIVTLGGDDRVSGLRGDDRVCTGPGNDTVSDIDNWQVDVDLAGGDDRLTDALELSVLRAGRGHDRMVLGAAPVDVDAGPGDDVVRVLPTRRRRPYNSPCVSYRAAPGPVHVNLTRGWARGQGQDRLVDVRCIRGGRFGDRIVGSTEADDLDVAGGDNKVWALGGNDIVYSNANYGADVFHLGVGNDDSMPGVGADRVYGGSGNEFIEAAGGPDYVEGGAGNDVIHASFRCDFGNSGGAGTVDQLPNEIFGGPGNDYLTGDLGNDRIDGGPGSDRGQGGYRDERIDWIESLETIVRC